MDRCMFEYSKQINLKESVLNQIYDIDEEIKEKENTIENKLSTGNRATSVVLEKEILLKERKNLEEIIEKGNYYDLTETKKIFEEEEDELKKYRSKRLKQNKIDIEEKVLQKIKEIEEILEKGLEDNEDVFNKCNDFVSVRDVIYPNNTLENHFLGRVIPNINFVQLVESEIFEKYKFMSTHN